MVDYMLTKLSDFRLVLSALEKNIFYVARNRIHREKELPVDFFLHKKSWNMIKSSK